jgi:cytochrome c-type biogenesis protein CcmH/NrfF
MLSIIFGLAVATAESEPAMDNSEELVDVLSGSKEMAIAESEPALNEPPLFDPPGVEETKDRSEILGKMLRCPVCQGLSVADSRSDAAVAMQNRIEELVSEGYSDEQIVDYFVSRYGEWALLKPKEEHWFVWSAPVFILFAGVGFVGWEVRRRTRQKTASPKQIIPESEALDSSYRDRILRELDGDE